MKKSTKGQNVNFIEVNWKNGANLDDYNQAGVEQSLILGHDHTTKMCSV